MSYSGLKDLSEFVISRIPTRDVNYADVRVCHRTHEHIVVRNGIPQRVWTSESCGVGIRVRVADWWGFSGTSNLTSIGVESAIRNAIATAGSVGYIPGAGEPFVPPPPTTAEYATPMVRDPFSVPLSEKLTLLETACAQMGKDPRLNLREASLEIWKDIIVFCSTTGSRISQTIVHCGAGIVAWASDKGIIQCRSYPASFGGNYRAAGYEFIEALDLPGNAPRVAAEAIELLTAPPCSARTTTVILESSQLALQIHESVGHPLELDRIFGFEASFAGTSFVTPDMLGKFLYASPLVNIVADATVPGGLGTFSHDDEGVAAQCEPLITEGVLTGVLSSCSTAPKVGRASSGAMRADGWQHFPLVRMTNINLQPGQSELDELIAETKDGIWLETNRSWSIDDRRMRFQFGTEIGREIHNGKLGRLVRNPIYRGITPLFWKSCDGICNSSQWKLWGVPNCGKGEPMQVARVGHGCAPARFRNVEVGSASG